MTGVIAAAAITTALGLPRNFSGNERDRSADYRDDGAHAPHSLDGDRRCDGYCRWTWRWLGKTGQAAKWSFCLKAASMVAEQEIR